MTARALHHLAGVLRTLAEALRNLAHRIDKDTTP
jgi:hypothetical protein